MTTIAADQAKTQFEAILSRAAQGEEILITENGKPMVRLVPATADEPQSSAVSPMSLEELREFRKGITLGPDLTIRQLIEEGRRH